MEPHDRLFDRDGDGKLDFLEEHERMDYEDFINQRGIYAEEKSDEDDEDLWDDDDDLEDDDDDGLGDDEDPWDDDGVDIEDSAF